jgi:hypothetical protein
MCFNVISKNSIALYEDVCALLVLLVSRVSLFGRKRVIRIVGAYGLVRSVLSGLWFFMFRGPLSLVNTIEELTE